MRFYKLTLLAAAILAACTFTAAIADVQCPKVFADHMVLQRQMPVPVWGKAAPGEKVTVTFAGSTKTATADAKGKWMVKLPALQASTESREMTITGSNNIPIIFKDVLVGEVWMISGQSNAESNLSWCNPQEGRTANNPLIRFMKVDHVMSETPQEDAPCVWQLCQPERALNFSGVGYYFAKKLAAELKIPVAILDDNWGGSNIRFWIPMMGWEMIPELKPELEARDREMKEYKVKMDNYFSYLEKWIATSRTKIAVGGVHEQMNFPPERNEFGFMFNGMIAPVIPYAMRGLLWYQGEYNAGDPGDIYYHKMRGLVGSWRKLWGYDFPMYFVQLPNLDQPNDDPAGGNGWARMREVQTLAMQIPNSGMAVTIDVGEAADIHPKNKVDVGERLARWALAKDYGRKNLVYRSPFYKDMKIEGDKIRISFDSVGSGLMVGKKDYWGPVLEDKGGALKRFAIAGADKKWVWATAKIDGDTVVVSSLEVPNPVAVRYSYAMNPEGCNLYNKDGLPASPFRTDNW